MITDTYCCPGWPHSLVLFGYCTLNITHCHGIFRLVVRAYDQRMLVSSTHSKWYQHSDLKLVWKTILACLSLSCLSASHLIVQAVQRSLASSSIISGVSGLSFVLHLFDTFKLSPRSVIGVSGFSPGLHVLVHFLLS